jgi:hypothetical protein
MVVHAYSTQQYSKQKSCCVVRNFNTKFKKNVLETRRTDQTGETRMSACADSNEISLTSEERTK